jgi:hypothetical protein
LVAAVACDSAVRVSIFAGRQGLGGRWTISLVAPLPHDPTSNPGLNISPDGRWLSYSIDDYRNFDIMLVENFQ